MTEWNIKGSRVYGDGKSFNCTNKITAETLYNTLTNYEKDIQLTKNTSEQLDRITKQTIQIQMTLTILQNDLDKLKQIVVK